jgi:hypothetical protein
MASTLTSMADNNRRRAWAIACVAGVAHFLLFGVGWALQPQPDPVHDLRRGQMSDHFSHVNAARVLPRMGLRLWQEPAWKFFGAPFEADPFPWPDAAEGRPELRINWQHFPRPYPPGFAVLFGPTAALFHYGALSFSQMTLAAVLTCVLGASLLLAAALWSWAVRGEAWWKLPFIALGVLGATHFALDGIYDAWPAAALVMALHGWWQRRPGAALAWFAVACFLHFRSIAFFPLALFATAEWLRQRRAGLRPSWVGPAVAVVPGGLALLTLGLIAPSLGGFPESNVLHRGSLPQYLVLALGALGVGWLLRQRHLFEAAVLVSLTAFACLVRQVMPWHGVVFAAVLLALPRTPAAALPLAAQWVVLAQISWRALLSLGWLAPFARALLGHVD